MVGVVHRESVIVRGDGLVSGSPLFKVKLINY